MNELKPCPFCGGPAKFFIDGTNYQGFSTGVKCRKCGAQLNGVYWHEEQATEAWNRRAEK